MAARRARHASGPAKPDPRRLLGTLRRSIGMSTPISELERFARELFAAAGMDDDKAATMAELLVLTDALGRRTHGLAMVPLYLAEIAKGTMSLQGEPEVVSARGVVV